MRDLGLTENFEGAWRSGLPAASLLNQCTEKQTANATQFSNTIEQHGFPLCSFVSTDSEDKKKEKAPPPKEATPPVLSTKQADVVFELQSILIANLDKLQKNPDNKVLDAKQLDQLKQRVYEEQKGVIRIGNEKKELNRTVFGEATKQLFDVYIKHLEKVAIPEFYRQLAQSKGAIPAKGAIDLPYLADGKTVMSPAEFLSRALNGKLVCNLHIDATKVPAREQLEKFSVFLLRAEQNLESDRVDRMREIAKRQMKRVGAPPSWKTDTPEQCMAAMYVLKVHREARCLSEAINFLGEKVHSTSKAQWLDKLKSKNLPEGMTIVWKDGQVTEVSIDWPEELKLGDVEMRRRLHSIQKWVSENKREVDQMMAEKNAKQLLNPKVQLAWMDLEPGQQWVRLKKDEAGKPVEYEVSDRELPGWSRANLVELRCGAKTVRDLNTGRTQIRISGSCQFCNVPGWSYANLIKPNSEGIEALTRDETLDPKDWVVVRTGVSDVAFMQAKDVQSFAEFEEFMHVGGKVVTVGMDVAMVVLGAGEILAGIRAIRLAGQAASTVKMLETAAAASKARTAAQGAELLSAATGVRAGIAGEQTVISVFQRELARSGLRHLGRGVRELALGVGGVLNNAWMRSHPGFSEAGTCRSLAFLLLIGKGFFVDSPRAIILRMAGGVRTASLGEKLIHLSMETGPRAVRTMGQAGRFGFLGLQGPLAYELIHGTSERIKLMSQDTNPILDAAKRLAGVGSNRLETSIRQLTGTSSHEHMLGFIEKYRTTVLPKANPAVRERIDRIMSETKDLLDIPWQRPDFVGPVDPRDREELAKRKQEFIVKELVPLLLASGDQIADHEKVLPTIELNDHYSLTDDEIHKLEQNDCLNMVDRDLRACAALSLIYLSKQQDGSLKGFDDQGESVSDAGVLYRRNQKVPPWTVTIRSGGVEVPGPEIELPITSYDISVPAAGHTRPPVVQHITAQDLVDRLERDLKFDVDAERRMLTGELLTKLGMPGEVYASVLESIIDHQNNIPLRTRALVNLGALMIGLRDSELVQETELSQAGLAIAKALAAGLSSKDIKQYLKQYATSTGYDKNTRALAHFLIDVYERQYLDDFDRERMQQLLRQPEDFNFDDYVCELYASAFQESPKAVPDIERKLKATLTLGSITDDHGKRLVSNELVTKNLVDCLEATRRLTRETVSYRRMVQHGQQVLDSSGKDDPEYGKKEKELARQKAVLRGMENQRVYANDLTIEALTVLTNPIQSGGGQTSRLARLDSSNSLEDQRMAMEVRRAAIDLINQSGTEVDDVTAKTTLLRLIPQLLSSSHLNATTPGFAEQKRKIDDMRRDLCLLAEGVLIAGLTDKKRIASLEQRYPEQTKITRQNPGWYLIAESNAEVRVATIEMLVQLKSRHAAELIKERLDRKNEPDADVRLAAVRAAKLLLTPQEFKEAIEPLVGSELDLAVALAMSDGSGQEGVIKGVASPSRSKIEDTLLKKDKYSWLTCSNLRDELAKAKESEFSSIFTYVFHDIFQHRSKTCELEAQTRALLEYRDKFARLVETAIESDGDEAKEARQLLFWLVTDSGESWKSTAETDEKIRKAGVSDTVWSIDKQDFGKLQMMASQALADCCTKVVEQSSGAQVARLSDPQLLELEKILQAGLKDLNVPNLCKLHFMRGLNAIANTSASKDNNSHRMNAKSVEVVLESLRATISQPSPSTRWSVQRTAYSYDAIARQQLELESIKYLSKFGNTREMLESFKVLDQTNLSIQAQHQIMEFIADKFERVIPAWNSTNAGQTIPDSPQDLAWKLESAEKAAYRIVDLKKITSDPKLVESFILAEEEKAIGQIFRATKSVSIQPEDPQIAPLIRLMTDRTKENCWKHSQRVRTAAAIAVFSSINIQECKAIAIKVLVETALRGERSGLRRDAQEVLDKIADSRSLDCFHKALEEVRESILKDMKTQLGAPEAKDDETITVFQKNEKDDRKLIEYAVCLTNLAVVAGKMGPEKHSDEDVTALYATAMNLLMGKQFDGKEESKTNDGKISQAMKERVLGSEHLFAAAYCLDRYAAFTEDRLQDPLGAEGLLKVSFNLRYSAHGLIHRDTIYGALRRMEYLDRDIAETVNTKGLLEAEGLVGQALHIRKKWSRVLDVAFGDNSPKSIANRQVCSRLSNTLSTIQRERARTVKTPAECKNCLALADDLSDAAEKYQLEAIKLMESRPESTMKDLALMRHDLARLLIEHSQNDRTNRNPLLIEAKKLLRQVEKSYLTGDKLVAVDAVVQLNAGQKLTKDILPVAVAVQRDLGIIHLFLNNQNPIADQAFALSRQYSSELFGADSSEVIKLLLFQASLYEKVKRPEKAKELQKEASTILNRQALPKQSGD